jgi:hypothetical protein
MSERPGVLRCQGWSLNQIHDHVTALEQENARLRAVRERDEALEWYAERARALHRYMHAKPPNAEAMTAVVTELALDNGQRAGGKG